MNLFGECPLKGNEVTIKSGPLAGVSFEVEDWARNVMAKKIDWPQDLGNPAVLFFWRDRKDLLERVISDGVEYVRVCLTGLYGHIGYSGHLVMLDELDCADTMREQEVTNAELDFQIRDNWRLTSENAKLRERAVAMLSELRGVVSEGDYDSPSGRYFLLRRDVAAYEDALRELGIEVD